MTTPALTTPAQSLTNEFRSTESNNHLRAAVRMRSVKQRTRPMVREVIKRCLITLAGLLGVIAILVTIAPFFGWTIVRLATGSMTPTFPTDSLLVTHTVPASEVIVGDIVTVQRAGELPITHRVVSVTALGSGDARLTLKGDGNRSADVKPYFVRSVGLVVGGIQGGGSVFATLRSTVGLAGLTVFATLIVLWAWWPSGPKPKSGAPASEIEATS